MKRSEWRQIGGDMDPGSYGGVIARFDGDSVEIREIQPVREYVGEDEAKEVGFPFWSNEGYYDEDDLDPDRAEMQSAMRSCGLDEEDLPSKKQDRLFALAECALRYGYRAEQGPSGWSKDVTPKKVYWATGEVAGPEYLEDEDEEFQELFSVTITTTYEIVTPASAFDGEAEERGWIDEEGTEYTVSEAVDLLEGTEPSSSEFHEGVWYTDYEYETDHRTGAVENRSYHIKGPAELQELIYRKVNE